MKRKTNISKRKITKRAVTWNVYATDYEIVKRTAIKHGVSRMEIAHAILQSFSDAKVRKALSR
jgi:hypothetical protein